MASILPPIDHPSSIRRRKIRQIKDLIAKHAIGIGGMGVIIAVTLIFVYLLYVVFPLFLPGDIEVSGHYPVPGNGSQTLHLATEEQAEIAVRFDAAGQIQFFDLKGGQLITNHELAIPAGTEITSFAAASPESRTVAYGLDDGRVLVVKHSYEVSYPDDVRTISPILEFPLGRDAIEIDESKRALQKIAIQNNEEQATVVAITDENDLLITSILKEESFMDDEVEIEISTTGITTLNENITHLLLNNEQRTLFLADSNGAIHIYDVSDPEDPSLTEKVTVVKAGTEITSLKLLSGDISLLIGDSSGVVSQWFPVRNEHGIAILTKIRQFEVSKTSVIGLAPEYFRKGFLTVDTNGKFGIYHTTAERNILQQSITGAKPQHIAISPRANAALIEDESGTLHVISIHNEHPEVSWSSLWGKVWYESYEKPDYVWQSSSASNDFEPKFSLIPISFGTIKAAFYAMLFAMPLAIMGAIYTAYFMTPRMRTVVKPTIEIMEALPTVILGFLAGLWLAPLLEDFLPAVLAILLLLPSAILASSYAWHRLPRKIQNTIPDGWQAALLIPVILVSVWICFGLNQPLENWLFGGDTRAWLTNELGVSFDQRNSLVVGIAMGFAVIPTIFSITEDAIFGVPKHLTNGSLALGATYWQTLTRVVILTASPGIFSAVMIGFGRAVGETMIVLMATGNTPVMDFSIFQGMRTLSANIAVEMPESEVASTHYRVLFLAALVLFVFTFMFNTVAEVVRQRLRKKYSSL